MGVQGVITRHTSTIHVMPTKSVGEAKCSKFGHINGFTNKEVTTFDIFDGCHPSTHGELIIVKKNV